MQSPQIVNQRRRPTATGLAGGIRLGRFAGVEFLADWSLLIIFALIALSLRFSLLPSWHPNWHPALSWTTAIAASLLFLASVALHELSHALVARHYRIGVRSVTLFLFGGFTQMDTEAPNPRAEFWMAIAGPAASVLVGIAATTTGVWLSLGVVASHTGSISEVLAALGPAATLLLWLGPINMLLGGFNMLPAYPLDGGRILRATLWWALGDLTRATYWAARAGVLLSLLLIAMGVAMALGVSLPVLGDGLVPGLWLGLIGWFLHNGALSSYQERLLRDTLEDVTVRDVMRSDISYVLGSMSLMTLARDLFTASDQSCFPVIDNNQKVIGVVTVADLLKVPRSSWGESSVKDVMTPVGAEAVLEPGESAFDALELLQQHEHIPVVQGMHLLGLVGRQDLSNWIAVSADTNDARGPAC